MQAPPPRVSVLMTTFNGERTIGESIASVLAQTFEDFELVVVDDASTDTTAALLAGIADPRLRVLRNRHNLGVVGARNAGFALCRGAYLAALDHDDHAAPVRLARQVALLDAAPAVVLAGTRIRELHPDGRAVEDGFRGPETPAAMRWHLHLRNPFTYSSVMVRAEAIRRIGGFMRPAALYADDFDLYHRLAQVGDVAMLPEVLCTYRLHAGNATRTVKAEMDANAAAILGRAYAPWLAADAPEAARLMVAHVTNGSPVPDRTTLRRLGSILERVLAGFLAAHRPAAADAVRIREIAGQTWWHLVRAAMRRGRPWHFDEYRRCAALRTGFRAPLRDTAASVAIGLMRTRL
ncbi:MAG TPA: glycosyltransferase family 2 protein [Acetobacteraceae bacterium]|nr:glycosyltransferase family 2 protein [Acetobacteraceae bacterium]